MSLISHEALSYDQNLRETLIRWWEGWHPKKEWLHLASNLADRTFIMQGQVARWTLVEVDIHSIIQTKINEPSTCMSTRQPITKKGIRLSPQLKLKLFLPLLQLLPSAEYGGSKQGLAATGANRWPTPKKEICSIIDLLSHLWCNTRWWPNPKCKACLWVKCTKDHAAATIRRSSNMSMTRSTAGGSLCSESSVLSTMDCRKPSREIILS